MENISYYHAQFADVKTLVDYRIEFFAEYWGTQPQQITDELKTNLEKYFSTSLANKTYISWLAKSANKIISIGGIVLREQAGNFINPSGRVGYLINMYTVPEHLRNGISTNILNRLIASAHKTRITAFELHSAKEGETPYQKNGFKIHGKPTYRKFIAEV